MKTENPLSVGTHFPTSTLRDSNIELLRIVAMLLVMLIHADFKAIGNPAFEELVTAPADTFGRFFVGALSSVCVNAFILISGWYGINFKLSGLNKLLFQVLFFMVLLSSLLLIWQTSSVALLHALASNYWFVTAYILLFILAPVLNAFADYADKSLFKMVLIILFLYQTLISYIGNSAWYDDGYSPLPFLFLYLLARYMRLYSPRWCLLKKHTDMLIWVGLSLAVAVCSITLLHLQMGGGRMYNYTSPVIVASSVYFFLFFTKLNIASRPINWIGKSAFAAFLLHMHPLFFDHCFACVICGWRMSQSLLSAYVFTIGYIFILFFVAILIDKVRERLYFRLSANKANL